MQDSAGMAALVTYLRGDSGDGAQGEMAKWTWRRSKAKVKVQKTAEQHR